MKAKTSTGIFEASAIGGVSHGKSRIGKPSGVRTPSGETERCGGQRVELSHPPVFLPCSGNGVFSGVNGRCP